MKALRHPDDFVTPDPDRRRRIRWLWCAPAGVFAIAIWREDGWLGLATGLALAVVFAAVAVHRRSSRQRE